MTTTSSQIIEVLDALCAKFGIVIDWTTANVLPYAQDLCNRIVRYEIAKAVAFIVIAILAVAIAWIVTVNIDDDGRETMVAISLIVTVIDIIVVLFCVAVIIRASFLPEAVIANYLKPYIC